MILKDENDLEKIISQVERPNDKEMLAQYLASKAELPLYKDDSSIKRAKEESIDRELLGGISGGLDTMIKGATGFDSGGLQAKRLMETAQEPVKAENERQKAIREYLKDKYDMGMKSKSYDLQLEQLKGDQAYKNATLELARSKQSLDEKKQSNEIPSQVKPAADELSKSVVSKVSIAQQIDAAIDKMELVPDDQKLQIGRELLKVLNSTEGKDAVGAEEVKRLGSKLNYGNWNPFNDNPMQLTRDLEGFMTDARNKSAIVKEASRRSKETYKSITGKEFPIEIPQNTPSEEEKSIARKKRIAELEALQSGVKK